MKYLMVDNGRVFYSLDGSAASKNPIDQISKDDLLTLLKKKVIQHFVLHIEKVIFKRIYPV